MAALSFSITTEQIYGNTDAHIHWFSSSVGIHRDMCSPWQQMVAAAKTAGFELSIASGYRSRQRQETIWQRKLSGELPVYDDQGLALDIHTLDDVAKAHAIMRWSALPGASRHHWGCDLDIYDKAALPADYQLQLIPEEYAQGGLFAPLCQWLRQYLQDNDSPDFFLPYAVDNGGVAYEPWHISYKPIAERYQAQWTLEACCQYLEQWQHPHAQVLINHIEALYDRYIKPSLLVPA